MMQMDPSKVRAHSVAGTKLIPDFHSFLMSGFFQLNSPWQIDIIISLVL